MWDLFIGLFLQLLLAIAEDYRAPKDDSAHQIDRRDFGGLSNFTFHQLPVNAFSPSPENLIPYDAEDPNIDIFVSKGRVNIGATPIHTLWEWIYHAIDLICPYGGENKCLHAYASFEVRSQGEDNPNDSYETMETVDVTVQYMDWGDSKQARHLLINAVAGVLARGSDHEDNCYWFYWWRKYGMDSFHHCNTADQAAVHLPGGYKIAVRLKGSSKRGKYHCNNIRPAVKDHVEGLHKEIEAETHTSHGQVRASCMSTQINGSFTPNADPNDETSTALAARDSTDVNAGVIDVYVGKNKVNIGSDAGNEIYDKVYKAIKEICPYGGGNNQCLRKNVKFDVWGEKDNKRVKDQIEVNVQYMSWANNEKAYYLLIGAVAGAFERGSQPGPNCYLFMPKDDNGWTGNYRYCNTYGYLEVRLPKDFKLAVNFFGPSNNGNFDCQLGVQATADYANSLKGEIEAVTGQNGLETHVQCTRNKESRDDPDNKTDPPDNYTAPPLDPPHYEVSKIVLELGTGAINVGSDEGGTLYNAVYQALLYICPFGGPASCYARGATFEVWAQQHKGQAPVRTNVSVEVDRSWWAYNKEIHLLLIGSVAGAFERGSYDPGNCYVWTEELGTWTRVHRFCNSINFVHVHFPGGPNMVVKFMGGGNVGGEMRCDSVIEPARKYVQTLQEEIETTTEVKDAFVDAKCVPS